ncbi:MAG TPA: hypothetical protein VKD91_00735 [Pyrinomonadaceae bacterium]|nr:hypothetical protein [Pyrinomonadaceae bacterium]
MKAVKLAGGHSLTRFDPAGGEAAWPSGRTEIIISNLRDDAGARRFL